MEEENNVMEETALIEDSSSDVEFACGDPKVEPRVGDEFQADIPPILSASQRALFLSTPPLPLDDDSSYSFLIGQPVQLTWIDKHPKGDDDDDDVDMNQSLKSFRAKRSRYSAKSDKKNPKSKKQRLKNLEAVPEIPSSSWEDHEVASFVLGLYTFGKNFTQVKKFMETKGTGDILLFYFGKFYNSAGYHTWSDSRKKRSRKCVYGRKLYSGWRQQLMLSRLIPSVSDESQIQKLVNVSKSFAEGKTTLEKYIDALKDLVGLRLLVDAVAIGKGKEDLTVRTSAPPPVKTKPWFTVSPKSSSSGLGPAYASLTSADIINQLKGSSRLSKARCSDIFWEAVWPRLLARGWHSEKPKDRSYNTSKDNIVFIVPGVKRFSRGELVKGDHYFDSVSDILAKVASEPELLEFETGGVNVVAENSSDQSDEEESSSPSGSQRHRYLKSPCSSSSRGNLQMRFTVVDTSLAAGGKLCDLRNLKEKYIVSEAKTGLGDKGSSLSSQKVETPQVMPLDAPMRFVIVDSSLDHSKKWSGLRRWKRLPSDDSSIKQEESLERVKDPPKRMIKHRGETNHHSVKSAAPSLKRRRLSACIKREKSLSKEEPESDQLSLSAVQHQNNTREEMDEEDKERYESVDHMKLKSDQSEKTGTGPSSYEAVETQEIVAESKPIGLSSIPGVDNDCSPEEVRRSHELVSSEHDSKGSCSVSGSEERRVSKDPEQEQEEVELPPITGANINSSPSKDLASTQEICSSEHDQQANNTDAPRRHSTRKRPLTTRALEALESGFLTTETVKSTVKPRKRERSSKRKRSAKVSNRAQLLPDNGIAAIMEQRGGEEESKATASNNPLNQIEDTKPSFILNGATTTESKALDQRHDSKPVKAEHPKLPPIILKLSLKRSRASET
ncbi:hypothetical protein Rs2_00602 [Raphanus sativus]|nr:uncharacterized protein LOC108863543 isoform X2 [Raphanus sativus]XP_018493522.1 uncharacterized protein LOC108863543 isoform X2 [Raphanus sativus]XP_018493529.1 uncharacterized protein LOC108863543 isoform X2 [Raphanus sativus]XP_018493536.1 uncharacterized protein LOC108863543 isoform X2 [Raphanus sativus]XP_018493544.1 uncharacterized protein LOC108863543 isoform X2 [Raphanus sativus]KAJ4915052.1 hypothetical protein Rs2_00602 [Raphanus sativus]